MKEDKPMVFQYYPDDDMLYLGFVERESVESEEVAPGIVLDFDQHGRVIGMEIENAGRQIDLSTLKLNAMPITTLHFTKRREAESPDFEQPNRQLSM